MNFLDFQQGVWIAFNPILLLLLGIWLAVEIISALADMLQGSAQFVRDRF